VRITIFTDLHLETPMQMDVHPKSREEVIAGNCYDLGDCVDMKGCENVLKAQQRRAQYQQIFDGRWVYGNHCLPGNDHSHDFIKVGNVLLTHGDLICWDYQKSQDFRNEKPGQGYGAVKKMLNVVRKLWINRISNFEVEQATKYCRQYGCNIIIYGHSHVSKVIERRENGIRIINCPRGMTVLDV
jgi:predicted phosphodiesterase